MQYASGKQIVQGCNTGCVAWQGQGMRAAEMLIWMGDFNYRVNVSYEDCKDAIRRKQLHLLLEKVSEIADASSNKLLASDATTV